MQKSFIAQNSETFPENFRREFDAHVYYTADTRAKAVQLREEAVREFHGRPVFVGHLIDRLVGPHPLPMFEIDFAKADLGEILPWLMHHRAGLSVLVHEVTGDDPKDHTQGAAWLGERVELDMSQLEPSPKKG